jgi:hypothetical protein
VYFVFVFLLLSSHFFLGFGLLFSGFVGFAVVSCGGGASA